MDEQELKTVVRELVAGKDHESRLTLKQLPGGGNNRVYRAEVDQTALLVKVYHHGSSGERDRLRAELDFARFAWRRGIRAIAEPIAADSERHVALYRFVEGRRLGKHEIDRRHVEEALKFFEAINEDRPSSEAARLPLGAEACFSIAEHLGCVAARLRRLERIDTQSDVDKAAGRFLEKDLITAWRKVHDNALERAETLGIAADDVIPWDHWCLSPSDFGFHNAVLGGEGRLVFCDFEYAGWDDPAKLVADFFCQVELPAPREFLAEFMDRVIGALALPSWHRARMELLLPIYQVKWCCIILNVFLPEGQTRRQYATGDECTDDRKRHQLQRAVESLSELTG